VRGGCVSGCVFVGWGACVGVCGWVCVCSCLWVSVGEGVCV
jgi:hypothetical protein